MASRPPPPGRLSDDARSASRPSVALRWLNNVAPAPAASKPVRSPVKRWPPPPTVEALPQTPALATPTLARAEEKTKPVSAFQSARAVFEAKQKQAAAPATPPSPPTRRRLASPAPTVPVVLKQHSVESDLSSSSCSTVDCESDRKLEEAQPAPMPSPPIRAAKTMEKEPVAATQVSVKASRCSTNSVAPLPAQGIQTSQSQISAAVVATPTEVKQDQEMRTEIDPFRLLLPVEDVPTLPDEVPCVYDSAAVEMEKNIKKVVRKLLKKNKARLEEFKVNSRLFGTDFMDSHAYLDTLIKYFGSIRALQLVPCLLSVQPDILKGNALLLTAKNYLLRNEEALKQECRSLHVALPAEIIPTGAAPMAIVQGSPHIEAGEVKSLLPDKKAATKSASAATAVSSTPIPKTTKKATAQATVETAVPTHIAINTSKDVSPVVQPSTLVVSPPIVTLASKEPQAINPLTGMTTATKGVVKSVEPVPEPQELVPPVINIAVSGPAQASTPAIAPTAIVKKRTQSDTPSDSKEEFRAENLFGETIMPSPKKKQQEHRKMSALVAPTSPASSTHSFEEAENLFGERLSSSSRSSVGRRKTVTWGETKTVEVPVDRSSPVKTAKKPAPLLFGLATAAAFESDSDESDFSD
ncbi:unnamed protein product [Phytophthora lilii]|uniref:Unnamed protein product n=1 Tax=Phytophthora lilii TaxID=2077276 RepID=A0A9W6TC45_9STRA|nr:unnamed protein product [Phytophthora lilii]